MDFQNGTQFQGPPHPLQQNHFNSSQPPATHPQPSPSPLQGQHPHYQDPRFGPAPSNQHQFNGANYPVPQAMSNGAGIMQQGQAQPRGQQNYYQQGGSGPYSQSIPTPPVTAAQKFAQTNQATSLQNLHNSPYSAPNSLPPQSEPSQTSPMSAPVSQSPATQFAQAGMQPQSRSVPQSPLSPEAQARDRERMTLLLEINSELLQELSNMQSQGKGGSLDVDGKHKVPAHKDYQELLKRLQVNLAFLAASAERFGGKPNAPQPPAGPAIMSAPSSPPILQELYTKLQNLFPGWKGGQSIVKNSPGPQQRQNFPPVSAVATTPTNQSSIDAKPQSDGAPMAT